MIWPDDELVKRTQKGADYYFRCTNCNGPCHDAHVFVFYEGSWQGVCTNCLTNDRKYYKALTL